MDRWAWSEGVWERDARQSCPAVCKQSVPGGNFIPRRDQEACKQAPNQKNHLDLQLILLADGLHRHAPLGSRGSWLDAAGEWSGRQALRGQGCHVLSFFFYFIKVNGSSHTSTQQTAANRLPSTPHSRRVQAKPVKLNYSIVPLLISPD
eukprot:1161231-Pelagomonas_calceolata.AAC.4